MDESYGGSLTSWLSKLTRNKTGALLAEILFLLLIGVSAVALQSALRYPFKLHGRHGLEVIALLMTGRLLSGRRWAGTASAIGAAAFSLLPGLGFRDPLRHVTYLLPGIVLDLGFLLSARGVWFLGLLGAVAHITKPIARLLIVGAAAYPSLTKEPILTLVLHAVFGGIGAVVAALGHRLLRKPEGTRDEAA